MIKKTITYVDFNGKERTEDFYFHLSLPEVTKLAVSLGATDNVSLSEVIKEIVDHQDFEKVFNVFNTIVLESYGEKTLDGKSFAKDPDKTRAFENSEAYAQLFEELLSDPESATSFFEGIGASVKKTNVKVIN